SYGDALYLLAVWISFALSLALLAAFLIALRRRAAEQAQALREWRERALRGESVVALASQAANVAHALNTPLSTVANVVADLRRSYANDDELGPELQLIDSQLDLCRRYIHQMVEISRHDAPPREQAAAQVIEAAVSQSRLLHPAVEFEVDAPPDPRGNVMSDPSLVHLLVGLLNNAVDATQQGAHAAARGLPRVQLRWRIVDGCLRVSVRDFGPGLTHRQRALAGAFGFSTKPGGLGLGLALGHLTAERLGGLLTLRDADEGGTIAELELPLAAARSGYDAGVSAASPAALKGGSTA
ncbi:MAG: HAMP domain-containing histidine kinase, partial [Burkholderiales bacterium]